jgi:ribosomal protein S27AE
MPLVDCAECGAKVSTSAHTCPQCRRAPGGGICVLCSQPIKIDDAYRIMAWERRGSAVTARTNRWDKFAHMECVLTLFPDAEAPCVDCGTPLNIRRFGLASGPTLMRATDPLQARWYESMDHGWVRVSFDQAGPGLTCPQCGSMRPLSRHEKYQPHCGHCHLPVLTIHDAEHDATTRDWKHLGCVEKVAGGGNATTGGRDLLNSMPAKPGLGIASTILKLGLAVLAGSLAAIALVIIILTR